MTCGRAMRQQARSNPAPMYPVGYHQQSPLKRPKMAVFDIDDTIFDATQREINARRAGLAPNAPYTGDRKPSAYPKGKKAFMDFFNSPKQFRIDPPVPGAIDFVRGLANEGYVICYLTGRPKQHHDATLEHLRKTGFPIFRRDSGEVLLYMKPNKKVKTAKFKSNTMRDLQSEYEILYFFDDLDENREEAFKLGVVGVYDLPTHLGAQLVKNNPGLNCGCGQTPCKTYGTRSNPSPARLYVKKEFEDDEEEEPTGPRLPKSKKPDGYRGPNPYAGMNPPEHLLFHPYKVPKGYREAAGCIVQRKTDGKILLLRRSKLETSMHGMYELPGGKLEEGETPKQAALIETEEEAGLKVRIAYRLPSHIDHDMKKVYHCFLGRAKKGARVKISEEHDEYKWVSIAAALKLPDKKLSHHARHILQHMKETPKVHVLGKTKTASGGIAIHLRIPPRVDPKKAKASIKGTKIVQKPGPDDKKCVSCVHYCVKTGKCHIWSKKKGSEVYVLPDWFCQAYEMVALPNPLPKPRKKNGRKEPSKAFVKRMMGNKKMLSEFPAADQRYAVTLRLVEKHYGKAARKKIAPRDNGLFGSKKHAFTYRDSFGTYAYADRKMKSPIYQEGSNPVPPDVDMTNGDLVLRFKDGGYPEWIEYTSASSEIPDQGRIYGPFTYFKFRRDGVGGADYRKLTSTDRMLDAMDRGASTQEIRDIYQEGQPDPQRMQAMRERFGLPPRNNPNNSSVQSWLDKRSRELSSENEAMMQELIDQNAKETAQLRSQFDARVSQLRQENAEMRKKLGLPPRNNPPKILPVFSGEPKGITKNLGGIFAEIQIGRNLVKDVGEVVQSVYRGLIGGRTTMAEKRMAMAIAEMQKELSDAAIAKGGNAVANLKVDYEMIPETATLTLIAHADAIKMRSPPKQNPAPSKKVNKAKNAYKKFHGGKAPKNVKTETIDVGDVWYALGPCWSIGYMSPKETGDDGQKYIHHTNEDSKDGNFPMMYATMPESGEPMIVIKGGSMKIGMRDGLAWLID